MALSILKMHICNMIFLNHYLIMLMLFFSFPLSLHFTRHISLFPFFFLPCLLSFLIFPVNLIFPCRIHFFSVCSLSASLSASIVNMFAYGFLFRVFVAFIHDHCPTGLIFFSLFNRMN